ncbi:MAG: hypothetical protein M1821_004844 [Bathelium mastoideum]|nr:MAG: hypothetical protein M1821_004844 [Bathelium mastoideum]
MSLFGGERAVSPEAIVSTTPAISDDDDAVSAPAEQSAIANELHELDYQSSTVLNATALPSAAISESSPTSDDEAEDSGSSSSSSSFSLPNRLNRFRGRSDLHKYYTRFERRLTDSVGQIRSNDLSIHLYNTHALKAGLRTAERIAHARPWSAKERWMDVDDPSNTQKKKKWHPRPWYTAWPLPPERVPRPEEVWGAPRDDRGVIYRSLSKETKASAELEDVLIGIIMRQAREQWDAREWAGENCNPQRKRRKRNNGTAAAAAADGEGTSEPAGSRSPSPSRALSKNQSRPVTDGTEMGEDEAMDRDDTGQPGQPKPVFMANEEQERLILKPIVRSLLADLDSLLNALHKSNTNLSKTRTKLGIWFSSAMEGIFHQDQPQIGLQDSGMKEQFLNPPETPKGSKPKGHQVSKVRKNDHVQDDTIDDSSESSSADNSNSTSESETPGSSNLKESSADGGQSKNIRPRQAKLNRVYRDWSEILNAAASMGWDRQVVHRAAARCSAIFGERMSFGTWKEQAPEKPVDKPIEYIPETIPPLSESESDDDPVQVRWDGASLTCVFPDCKWSERPYTRLDNLLVHMRNTHQFDPYKEKTDKRVGAVHNDGFLLPVIKPQNMRAVYHTIKLKPKDLLINKAHVPKRDRGPGTKSGIRPKPTISFPYYCVPHGYAPDRDFLDNHVPSTYTTLPEAPPNYVHTLDVPHITIPPQHASTFKAPPNYVPHPGIPFVYILSSAETKRRRAGVQRSGASLAVHARPEGGDGDARTFDDSGGSNDEAA